MQRSVFHERWWLDAVAPGTWREVVIEKNGAPVARLPYVTSHLLGFRLQVAPPLSARLGPLVDPGPGRYETRIRHFDHLVDDLIDRLPPADLFRQALHPETLSWLPFHRRGFRVEPRISYLLDDLSDLDRVWNGISGQTRRVIRAAGRELEVVRDEDAVRLERMVRSTFRRQRLEVPFDSAVLDRVIRAALDRERAVVLSAVDATGATHASLYCVWDDCRAWYLGGGGDPALRSSGAGSLLMWELIKESAKHVACFDFEGSMLPGVERYFRNFGGRRETYFEVSRASTRFAPLWATFRHGRGSGSGRIVDRLRRIVRSGGGDPSG